MTSLILKTVGPDFAAKNSVKTAEMMLICTDCSLSNAEQAQVEFMEVNHERSFC